MQILQLSSPRRLLDVLSFARFNGSTAYANKSLKTIVFLIISERGSVLWCRVYEKLPTMFFEPLSFVRSSKYYKDL